MDFILDNNTVETEFLQLIKLIKLRQNGVTSTSMTNKGMDYELNYGVSFTVLKELSTRFNPNNLLAHKLWNHGWRETYILATLLTDLENFDITFLEKWSDKAPTEEVLNHIATNLTVNLPSAITIMSGWITSEKEHRVVIACKTLTKLTFKQKAAPEVAIKTINNWIESNKKIKSPALIRAIGDMVRTIGRFETAMRPAILAWAKRQTRESASSVWDQKFLEIDAEFKYL